MKGMVKKITTKLLMFLEFALVTSMVLGIMKPTEVKAAEPKVNYSESAQFMFSPEWDSFGMFCVENLDKNAKVSVTVSNKKVASASWDERQNIAFITAKKPCTITATLKIKQGGKTYTYTSKMTWVTYKNPLKSLQIGSTKYNVSYFNKNTQASMKKVSGNKAVKVTLKNGYKITSLGFSRGGKYKQIQNGSKIKFTKAGNNNTVLFVNYQDSKGNSGVLRLFVGDTNKTLL